MNRDSFRNVLENQIQQGLNNSCGDSWINDTTYGRPRSGYGEDVLRPTSGSFCNAIQRTVGQNEVERQHLCVCFQSKRNAKIHWEICFCFFFTKIHFLSNSKHPIETKKLYLRSFRKQMDTSFGVCEKINKNRTTGKGKIIFSLSSWLTQIERWHPIGWKTESCEHNVTTRDFLEGWRNAVGPEEWFRGSDGVGSGSGAHGRRGFPSDLSNETAKAIGWCSSVSSVLFTPRGVPVMMTDIYSYNERHTYIS